MSYEATHTHSSLPPARSLLTFLSPAHVTNPDRLLLSRLLWNYKADKGVCPFPKPFHPPLPPLPPPPRPLPPPPLATPDTAALFWAVGPPGSPVEVVVSKITDTSVQLSWGSGPDNHSPVTSYTLQARTPYSVGWQTAQTGDAASTTTTAATN